jgi:hypothetical protein
MGVTPKALPAIVIRAVIDRDFVPVSRRSTDDVVELS